MKKYYLAILILARYEKLKVWNADGAELSARMTISDGEIRLSGRAQ